MTARRTLELLIIPALVLAAFAIPFLVWADRLPDEIAMHWSQTGTPDGSGTLNGALWIFMTVWITSWAGLVILLRVQRMGGTEARILVGAWYWLGAMLVGMWTIGLAANLDTLAWKDAGNLTGVSVLVVFVAAIPMAVLGWFLADGRPDREILAGIEVAPLEGPADQLPIWSGAASSIGLLVIALVPIGVGTWFAFVGGPGAVAAAPLLAAGLAMALLATRVRVFAGPRGLRIGLGWLGWPVRTIPIEDITRVAVEHVVPMEYGGWGFRMARGAQAYILRGGPAIRVERRTGSAIVVTVDGADQAAAVLARHHPSEV